MVSDSPRTTPENQDQALAEPPPADRRIQSDRRTRPTPPFSPHWIRGSRRSTRRGTERHDYFVDRPNRREVIEVASCVLVGTFDAIATLYLLSHGWLEANPLLAKVLESGTGAFLVFKLGLTTLFATILLIHIRFRPTRPILAGLLLAYAAVAIFQITAISNLSAR